MKVYKPETDIWPGEQDLADFLEIADIFSEKIPGLKKITVPNAGHLCNKESPDYFKELVLRFLKVQTGIQN